MKKIMTVFFMFLTVIFMMLISYVLVGCVLDDPIFEQQNYNSPVIVSESPDYTLYKVIDGNNVCYYIENNYIIKNHNDPLPELRCLPISEDEKEVMPR